MKTKRTPLAWLVSVTLVVALYGQPLPAAPVLQLSSGGDVVLVEDNSPLDGDPLPGLVNYSGAVGNFIVQVNIGFTKPVLGSPAAPHLDLFTVNESSAGGELNIQFSDVGFTADGNAVFVGELGMTTFGTALFNVYAASSNVALDTNEPPVLSQGPFSNGAFSDTEVGNKALTAPYSITMEAVITHPPGVITTDFDHELTVTNDSALTCPPDITVQCLTDIPPAATTPAELAAQGGIVNACAPATLTHQDVVTGDACSGIVTRTYTLTDCQNNVTQCIQVIAYADTIFPTITCPPNLDLGCNPVVPECDINSVTVDDNCGATVTCSSQDIVNGCEYTRILTYTATDVCGNQSSCSQEITWTVDTAPPTIVCAPDLDLGCNPASVPGCDINTVTATDDCGVTVTCASVDIVDGCFHTRILTYTATDACGQQATCTQQITWVEDVTPPEIVCAADKTVECGDDWTFDLPSLSDECVFNSLIFDNATNDLKIRFNPGTDEIGDEIVLAGTARQLTTFVFEYYGSNSVLGYQFAGDVKARVRFYENDGPVVAGAASPGTVLYDSGPFSIGATPRSTLLFDQVSLASGDVPLTTPLPETFTWTVQYSDLGANDEAGVDIYSPVVLGGAYPDYWERNGGNWQLKTNAIASSMNFAAQFYATLEPITFTETTVTNALCGLTFAATRTWTATDPCGNEASCSQTVTILDTTDPVIVCAPNQEVPCGDAWTFDAPTASDICGDVTIQILSTVTNALCGPTFTAVRTWEATDDCGNTSQCSQTVTIVDTLPPVLVGCPVDMTVECDLWPQPAPAVTATDLCDPNPTVTFTFSTLPGPCPQSVIVERTWTATDACGNQASCSQVVTVVDTTPPVLAGCPADVTVECDQWPLPAPVVTATDNCDPNPTIMAISSIAQGPCPETFVVSRTWTAVDACGNEVSCSQLVTVVDTTAPLLTCPADVTVECLNTIPPDFAGGTVTDNCDPNPVVEHVSDVTVGTCPAVTTRTYRATDACGNVSTCVQTITAVDTTPPVITCTDITVECDQLSGVQPDVTDNCGLPVTLTYADAINLGSCPEEYVIVRTWTAADSCTNTASCVQTINVVDTTPPVVTCPPDLTVECGDCDPNGFGQATAVDNCDPKVELTYADTEVQGQCPTERIITRTWTAIDDCDNVGTCVQTIVVTDLTPPLIFCAPDRTVECDTDWAFDPPLSADECIFNTLVFDNATNDLMIRFNPGTTEIGDEIVLAGTGRDLSLFVFEYYGFNTVLGNQFAGDVKARVRFYQNDGPVVSGAATPGALIYDSGAFSIGPTPRSTLVFDEASLSGGDVPLTVPLPDTFTWSVQFSDLGPNDEAGVDIYSPPVLGSAFPDYWENAGGGWQLMTNSVADDMDFAAQFYATTDGVTLTSTTVTNALCGLTFAATRTWTATDVCGNAAECSQTITVIDTVPPVVACPPDLTIECDSDPDDLGLTGQATATDTCGAITNLAYTDMSLILTCPDAWVILRTWRATDECGNVGTCLQRIAVVDTTPPVLAACPPDVTVECDAIPLAPMLTATDNCDQNPAVTLVTTSVPGPCPEARILTHTWTARDACGNASFCSQIVTVVDTVPPVLTCPPAQTVECTQPADPSVTGWAVAVDDCDPEINLTYVDASGPGQCAQETIITRTWTAIDDCQNTSTCIQLITVTDTTPPVIVCPSDLTLECDHPTGPAIFGVAYASDKCDPAPTVAVTETVTPGACPDEQVITRSWTATDACGNVASCQQVITIRDTTPPVLTCAPDKTVECTEPVNFDAPTAADNCDADVTLTFADAQLPGACPQEYQVTRTWTAEDNCGNTSTCQQTLTVVDRTPPVIACPPDQSLECTDPTDPAATGLATAADTCDPAPTVAYVDILMPGVCPVEQIIRRTWTATDACGNSATCVQILSVVDATPPVVVCPPNQTIECGTPTTPPATGLATATDVCDPDVTLTYGDAVVVGACPEKMTITRTWTATDDCGNSATCVQIIEVVDTQAPILTCPIDVTVECTSPTDPTVTGSPEATDNCDPVFEVTYADEVLAGACPQDRVILRTWTARDDCENTSTCVQRITVQDTVPPVLICPVDTTVECTDSSTLPARTGRAIAYDACTPGMGIIPTYTDSVTPGACPGAFVVERTWTATDDCGNLATCVQLVTVADNRPPVITCAPDQTIECNEAINFTPPTVADNCDPSPAVTFADATTPGQCPQSQMIARTWTAVDACGNVAICRQVFTVIDSAPPAIVCPPAVTINCDQLPNTDVTGLAAAVDVCDPAPEVTYSDARSAGECPAVVTRTWTARDACGNAATCVQLITIVDDTPPVIVCPADATVECDEPTDPGATGWPTMSDDCDPAFELTYTDVEGPGGCPQARIITRTWQARDDCNNISTCVQRITVLDRTPPTVFCPPNLTVDCDALRTPAQTGTANAVDACDPNPSVSFSETITPGACPQSFTLVRRWTAVDACGNAAFCDQTITVLDQMPPVVLCPPDRTVQCGQPTDPGALGSATAEDNCDPQVGLTFSDTVLPGRCLQEQVINRTWTAVDDCGNSAACVQRISVVDNTPPVLTGCPAAITAECDAIPAPLAVSATDNCDPAPVVTLVVTSVPGVCPEERIMTRTWTARDACGNTASCSQQVTVVDTTPPALVCPNNVTVQCDAPTDPFVTGFATGTDNCDPVFEITYADVMTPGACPQELVIVRTWTALDDCGNSSTCVQRITVEDTTPPVVFCPPNRTVECDEPVTPNGLGTAVATDVCDPNPTVTYADAAVPGACPQETVITRTWTATDACGNVATCQQTITQVDTTPPVVLCPPNRTFECDETPAFGQPTISDNCDPNPVVTFTDVQYPGICPQETVIIRTWAATDACGNVAMCSQTVRVVDDTAPVISCPPAVTITVDDPRDPSTTCAAVATDNCDPAPVLTYRDVMGPGACFSDRVITRTWTAADACGNVATCLQTITVIDPNPCLALTKTASAPVIDVGQPVSYTYCVSNCSCRVAYDVVVTDDNGTPDLPGDDVVVGVIPMLEPGETACLTRDNVFLPIAVCCPDTGLQTGTLVTQVLPDGNIQATFIQAFEVNDNTYGANTIGWNRDHKFSNLTGSDKAQFQFKNGAGQVVLDFEVDYISASAAYPSGYGTLGVSGGDGDMNVGNEAHVLAVTTSLTENLNQPPFLNNLAQYTVNSPALSDPNSAAWEYRMIYTVVVDQAAFAGSGFGGFAIVDQHNSPAKQSVCKAPVPCPDLCVTNLAAVSGFAVVTVNDTCDTTVMLTNTTTQSDSATVCIEPPCAPCEGKVSELTLEYLGNLANPQITVLQKNGVVVFQDTVPPGGQFSFQGTDNGTLGTEIKILVNGIEQTSIHTSCSQPIGPGLVRGDFRVVAGSSLEGGKLCPLPLPCIDVTMDIACLMPGENCGSYSPSATGMKGTEDPAFCYRIIVRNCGTVGLDNLTVVDSKLGDLTSHFFPTSGTVLPPNTAVTNFFKMAWGQTTTNTVTGRGESVTDNTQVADNDTTVAQIIEPGLICQMIVTSPADLDGDPGNNQVRLPETGGPYPVTFTVVACNEGPVDLFNVVIASPELAALGCGSATVPSLPVGTCVTNVLCTLNLSCAQQVAATMTLVADLPDDGCIYGFDGNRIQAQSSCLALVVCGEEPEFQLFKQADRSTVAPGGLVTYTYTVTNSGTVTLTGLVVIDDNGTPGFPNDDIEIGTVATLAPGAVQEFVRQIILPVTYCVNGTGAESGLLYTQVLPNGDIQATFIQSFDVNDNTYGVNSIGWGKKVHKFSNLVGSDKAVFQFRNGAGAVALEFGVDYISQSSAYPSGYGTLGVTGGDGKMDEGSASSVLSAWTSLTENLNKAPFLNNLAQYTMNSPALSDPNSGQWEYRMIYSVVVDDAAFGPAGFGSAAIVDQHNSPSKTGSFTPEPCGACITNIAVATAVANGTTLTRSATAVVCTGEPTDPQGFCPNKADYWKKNTARWPAAYTPNQTVGSVFAAASLYPDAAGKTLLQALDGKAGANKEARDLLKEAVAAVLNAATPEIAYPLSEQDVIMAVNMALTNGGNEALKSLKELLKEANEDKNCNEPPSGGDCTTDGKPNTLTLSYTGASCAQAANSQPEGKTSCSEIGGGPAGATSVRVIASSSSTPPGDPADAFFDGVVSLDQSFVVHGDLRSNTYFHVYVGGTLVQTIQMHTSCSAPLIRGETFGSLRLVDYSIQP